jgi:hypothetical protein
LEAVHKETLSARNRRKAGRLVPYRMGKEAL